MVAFFAATPFQIFNCANIRTACFGERQADLFVLTFAADNTAIYEKCKKSGAFDNVYLVSEPFNGIGRAKFLRSYLRPDRRTVELITGKKYTHMFSTRIGPAADFYYTHMRKVNPELSFNYYDEGVGDYFYEIHHKNTALVRLAHTFGYKDPFKIIDKLWLYKPELRCANLQYHTERIPNVNDRMYGIIADVFGVAEDISLPEDCKLIYFDQPFLLQQNFDIDDCGLLREIEKVIPHENIYVKLHPVNKNSSRYNGYKKFPDFPYPWEVVMGRLALEDTILVAVNSTAVVTPYTVYGKTPSVIMTYKMFPDKPFLNIELQRKYFGQMAEAYGTNTENKQNGIMALPANTDELNKALLSVR